MRIPITCAVLLVVVVGDAIAEDADKKNDFPIVSVYGQASEDIKPDKAIISFGIFVEEKTASEAAAEIAKRSQTLAAEIRSAGVDPRDIKTSRLRLDPVYVEDRDPKTQHTVERKLTRFRATNNLVVTTRHVDGVGALVMRLLGAQANTLQGVQFSVENEDDRRSQLLGKAVVDAKRKAQIIADNASMRLGPLVEIDFSGGGGGEADLPAQRSAMNSRPTTLVIPVEPGENRLNATITAKWRLMEK